MEDAMPIYNMLTNQVLVLTNKPGSIVSINGTYDRVNLENSPGSIVQTPTVNKWDNVYVNDSPGSIVQMHDVMSSIDINSSMAFAYGSNVRVTVGGGAHLAEAPAPRGSPSNNNLVEIYGQGDRVTTKPNAHNTMVHDHGLGTTCTDLGAGMTVYDFDATAKIDVKFYGLTPDQAVAAERSDGHGGTLIAGIDVVGVPHIDASHFTSYGPF
jgi:hypothetical protein